MPKHLFVGAALALVMLVGAGCNSSAPVATNSDASLETKTTAPADEAKTDTNTPADTAATTVEGAPLEITMLGLNEDTDALRFRAKVVSAKDIKKAFITFTCVYDEGKDPETFNSAWNNENDKGEAQPIGAGKTYESQMEFGRWAVSCSEMKLTSVQFTDGTEWPAS